MRGVDCAREFAWVDQGYTGDRAVNAAAEHGVALEVVKLSEAKCGFVVWPQRWAIERRSAWTTHFRRVVKDDEHRTRTLARIHVVVFACFIMKQAVAIAAGS